MTYILIISINNQLTTNVEDTIVNYVEYCLEDPYCISVIGNNSFVKGMKEFSKNNEWRFLTHNDHTIAKLDSHLKESPDVIYCFFQKIKTAEELAILKAIHFYDKLMIEKKHIRPIIKIVHQ